MKIPFTGYQITLSKITPKLSEEDQFIHLAQKMTECWEENYKARTNLVPWVDWVNKEVFVAERSAIKRRK